MLLLFADTLVPLPLPLPALRHVVRLRGLDADDYFDAHRVTIHPITPWHGSRRWGFPVAMNPLLGAE